MANKQHPLVGKTFHTTYDEHMQVVKCQGSIVACLDGGFFLCELFSWIDGCSTHMQIYHISEMGSWRFYNDREQMNDWYERVGKSALHRYVEKAQKQEKTL